jgi:hypothetical protein
LLVSVVENVVLSVDELFGGKLGVELVIVVGCGLVGGVVGGAGEGKKGGELVVVVFVVVEFL